MHRHFIAGLFAVLFFQHFPSPAQGTQADTLFVAAAQESAREEYTLEMEGQSNIFSGTEYGEHLNLRDGQHPFFLVDDWSDGSVFYDGEFYKKVSLMYDILKDGVYHKVNDKASVLAVLADQKPALKKFISDKKINFRADREKAIARVAEFYYTIKK